MCARARARKHTSDISDGILNAETVFFNGQERRSAHTYHFWWISCFLSCNKFISKLNVLLIANDFTITYCFSTVNVLYFLLLLTSQRVAQKRIYRNLNHSMNFKSAQFSVPFVSLGGEMLFAVKSQLFLTTARKKKTNSLCLFSTIPLFFISFDSLCG